MKVPILDLAGQYKTIRPEIDKAVQKVIKSQHFILGEEVEGLEKEIARYCQTAYGVGVASGTDALILALRALGIGPGDEVITTPFTFFATAEAISLVGAKPVFVDIEPKGYTIDPALIEAKITKATKAIIPVHLYGQCADMDPICAIAKRHNIKIIEDCAQAIGATYKARKAGSMGDFGALSFFPSKNLGGFGDGGMLVTNDKRLADTVKLLRVHGSLGGYIHSMIGTNSRLGALQAAVVRVKLKYLDRWLTARRKIAAHYDKALRALQFKLPHTPSYNIHTYYLYVVRVVSGAKHFKTFLTQRDIEARTYYPLPLHLQECYRSLGYKKDDFKESERASQEVVAIPLYPELTKRQLDYVIHTIKDFFTV